MKKAIALVLTLAMTISLLAGCSSSSTDTSSSSTDTSAASSSTASSSDSSSSEVAATDPTVEPDGIVPGSSASFYSNADCVTQLMPSSYPQGNWMYVMIYDTLFYSPSGNWDDLTGLIAKEWVNSEDGCTWVVTIHDNIDFVNGNHMTAQSVIDAFQVLIDNGGINTENIESLTVTGEYELTFVYKNPHPEFMYGWSNAHAGVFDATMVNENGGSTSVENFYMAGSGPYYISDYAMGDYMTFTANENYWNEDRMPHIETLNCKVILDTNTQTTALLSGEIDCGPVSDYDAYETLLTGDLNYNDFYGVPRTLWFNNQGMCSYLSNIRVREALTMMIDEPELAAAATGGYGYDIPNAFNDILDYTDGLVYDPEGGLAILAEEGIDPSDIVLTALVDAATSPLFANLQSQLGECGVTLDYSVQDSPAVMSAGWAGEWDIWSEYGGLNRYSYYSPVRMMFGITGTHNMVHDDELDPVLWELVATAFSRKTIEEEMEYIYQIIEILDTNYCYLASIQVPSWHAYSTDMYNFEVCEQTGGWMAWDSWMAY